MAIAVRDDRPVGPELAPSWAPATVARAFTPGRWVPKLCIVGADLVAISVAMGAAFFLRSALPGYDVEQDASRHFTLALSSLPVWVAVFAHSRLYAARCLTSRLDEVSRVVHGVVLAVLGVSVLAFSLRWYVARGWLLLTAALAICTVALEREGVRRFFAAQRRRGRFLRPVVIAGGNAEGLAICEHLMTSPELGYRVVGFVDDRATPGEYLYDHRPVLGPLDGALDAVRQARATSVLVATTAVDAAASNRLVRELTEAGVHVELSSSLRDISAERLLVRSIGAHPVVYVEPVRRGGWRRWAKRALDVSAAAGALIALTPVMAVIAIAIKLGSRGPVFFRQERFGLDGHRFMLAKFRTMVEDAEAQTVELRERNEVDGPIFKMRRDPRVTSVGRVLRRYSLDELPQFWNVLRGEMSLVGPRPLWTKELEAAPAEAHERSRVKPGLTGMWQVNGRSDATFDELIRLDMYYVDNWSLWTDLAIVAKTIPAVLLRRGAY